MNGFNSDIVNILRARNLFHQESIGLILCSTVNPKARELVNYLRNCSLRVSDRRMRGFSWDYIVISQEIRSLGTFLACISQLTTLGILVLEITDNPDRFQNRYTTAAGAIGLVGTKVIYNDRVYLVFHVGNDYGN
jgi:hypothetical protein